MCANSRALAVTQLNSTAMINYNKKSTFIQNNNKKKPMQHIFRYSAGCNWFKRIELNSINTCTKAPAAAAVPTIKTHTQQIKLCEQKKRTATSAIVARADWTLVNIFNKHQNRGEKKDLAKYRYYQLQVKWNWCGLFFAQSADILWLFWWVFFLLLPNERNFFYRLMLQSIVCLFSAYCFPLHYTHTREHTWKR